jgi:DNA-nicking Smr family endonuclease
MDRTDASGLWVAQDTGGAIKGANRVDTFWGAGDERAVAIAGGMSARGGRLVPDLSVDLHGLNLAAAHLRLDRLLGEAIMSDARVLLVVTGKPRSHRPLPGENGKRGAIRAEIGDWLARSPYAGRIASVRAAHLRHGGEGALYIILRRPG